MFSCRDVLAELSNLVDEELPLAVRRQVEHHLAECVTCQILYDSMRKTVVVVTETGSFSLPDAVGTRIRDRVMARIRGGAGPGEESSGR